MQTVGLSRTCNLDGKSKTNPCCIATPTRMIKLAQSVLVALANG